MPSAVSMLFVPGVQLQEETTGVAVVSGRPCLSFEKAGTIRQHGPLLVYTILVQDLCCMENRVALRFTVGPPIWFKQHLAWHTPRYASEPPGVNVLTLPPLCLVSQTRIRSRSLFSEDACYGRGSTLWLLFFWMAEILSPKSSQTRHFFFCVVIVVYPGHEIFHPARRSYISH